MESKRGRREESKGRKNKRSRVTDLYKEELVRMRPEGGLTGLGRGLRDGE